MVQPTFQPIPMLRIFDVDKAKDFYIGFLAFSMDWEHRFDDRAPVYMQVPRGRALGNGLHARLSFLLPTDPKCRLS